MFVEMKVRGLALDPLSNMPIIILRDEEDKRSLPIWVGIFEANAIALELEKISTPRPMTHDLMKNILETIDARVMKIVVTALKENTFFAVLHLRLGSQEYTVDSRPSDAIALALRVAAPIYVEEDVFPKAGKMEVTKDFRNAVDRPRVDFFHILAVSSIPGLIIDGDVPGLQDPDDFPDINLSYHPAQLGRLDVILGNHNGHSVF